MARLTYGLDLSSYGIDAVTGAPVPFALYQVWPAAVGGDPVVDLEDITGNPVEVVTADAYGFIGFYGPDGWDADLWLEGAAAVRLLVRPVALTERVRTLEATSAVTSGITQAAADARYVTAVQLAAKVGKGELVRNLKDYGAVGDGATDDTAAVAAWLAAGPRLFAPPGIYLTDGGHTVPPYTHIEGSEPASRYWGYNATTHPPVACALQLRAGSTAPSMLMFGDDYTAGSVRNLTLLGAGVGSSVDGMAFDAPLTEHNFQADHLAVIGFTGDGVRGRLWAQRWSHVFVGGNRGWGLTCDSGNQWSDVHFTDSFVSGNVAGGLRVDSTGDSGLLMFDHVRFERSGWNPATSSVVAGATGAPGVQIRGNLKDSSFVGCTTDANSGHGVDIDRISGRNNFLLFFANCNFRRDGFGDMATLGNYAGVRVRGLTGGNTVDNVCFSNCSVSEGYATDGGTDPTGLHPKYGLWLENLSFPRWTGPVSAGIATPLYGGAAGWAANWRPRVDVTNLGHMTVPVWDNTGARPTPTVRGQVGINDTTGDLEWWSGSGVHTAGTAGVAAWASVTGLAANSNMTADPIQARVEGGAGRLQGKLDFTGAVTANTTLFTVPVTARPSKTIRTAALAHTSLPGTLTITTGGAASVNQAFASGDTLLLDGTNWGL